MYPEVWLPLVGMPVWAFFAYRHRERAHREMLSRLRRTGELPPDKPEPVEFWKIFTTAEVAALLILASGLLIDREISLRGTVHPLVLVICGMFLSISVVLWMMVAIDIRIYRREQAEARRACHS